jgi:hypothetical protein
MRDAQTLLGYYAGICGLLVLKDAPLENLRRLGMCVVIKKQYQDRLAKIAATKKNIAEAEIAIRSHLSSTAIRRVHFVNIYIDRTEFK